MSDLLGKNDEAESGPGSVGMEIIKNAKADKMQILSVLAFLFIPALLFPAFLIFSKVFSLAENRSSPGDSGK